MNIKIDYIDNKLSILDDDINVIEVENKKVFYRLVNDLYKIYNIGYSDSIIFFDDNNNEINMSNRLQVYLNFFDFEFDSKKNINQITKHLIENINEESKNELIAQYTKLIKLYGKVLNNIDLPLSIDIENFEGIIKMIKLSIDNSNNDLVSNILLLIDIEKTLSMNDILVFVNLKQYLDKDELLEIYKYALYNQVKIILIDSRCYGVTLKYEKKLIIDENLDEFVL